MSSTADSLSGAQFVISSGDHTATVVEVGAGLQRYTVGGVDVTGTYRNDVLPPNGCGTTLVPWPNRIRNGRYSFDGVDFQLSLTEPEAGNAIHGLGRWVRWTKVHQTPSEIGLLLDVVPQKGYPFPLRVQVTYNIDAERGLTVSLAARNTGVSRVPFGAGSHPYLATHGHRLDDVMLRLPAREALVVDDSSVPIGSRSLDDSDDVRRGRLLGGQRFDQCFTGLITSGGRGFAEVRTNSGGAQLWFDETFRFLQVFTLDSLGGGPPGLAIEPMTCAPDAFNSGAGLIVLEPDGVWTGSWGIVPL